MSDISGGDFSRPVGDPPLPAEDLPVKRALVTKAAAKKAAVKKAPARKATVAKKAAGTRKAATPAVKAAAKSTAKRAPAKKAGTVKKAATTKSAATKKAAAPRKAAAVKRAGAAAALPPPPAWAGTAEKADPFAPPRPGSSVPASPPLPAPPAGGLGLAAEPTLVDPIEAALVPAPPQSRKDRRAAKRADKQKGPGPQVPVAPATPPKRRTGRRALVVVLLLVLVAAAVAVALALANQDDGTDYADLKVGDCVRSISADPTDAAGGTDRRTVTVLDLVKCTEAHEAEVFATTNYPGSKDTAFPGDEEIGRFVSDFCQGAAFEQYVGKPRSLSGLVDDDIQPSAASWKAGRRNVICLATNPSGASLTASVRGSGR